MGCRWFELVVDGLRWFKILLVCFQVHILVLVSVWEGGFRSGHVLVFPFLCTLWVTYISFVIYKYSKNPTELSVSNKVLRTRMLMQEVIFTVDF